MTTSTRSRLHSSRGSRWGSAAWAVAATSAAIGLHFGCGSETGSGDDGGSGGGGGGDSPGGGCSGEGTQYAPCEVDDDCYSGNCQDGTSGKICYGGNGKGPPCSTDDECVASAPSPAAVSSSAKAGDYAVFCAGGGCVVNCKE